MFGRYRFYHLIQVRNKRAKDVTEMSSDSSVSVNIFKRYFFSL